MKWNASGKSTGGKIPIVNYLGTKKVLIDFFLTSKLFCTTQDDGDDIAVQTAVKLMRLRCFNLTSLSHEHVLFVSQFLRLR